MTNELGLKRHFNGDAARLLGDRIEGVRPGFDIDGYVADTERRIPGKELKDRVLVLTEGLRDRLPPDYPEALAILLAILGDELAEGEGMFNASWFLMPVARFVEEYGLDHVDVSLDALEAITRRHTAEYAIRPFLEHHRDATMERVAAWARSPSHNVRRLASEGIRPRLPWARTLTPFVEDPAPVLAVLEPLRSDPSEYVRKSVANNLNDISKDNGGVALATARRWSRESPTPETAWIVKHGLRTLVKKGDQRALAILGVTGGEHLRVSDFTVTPRTLALGGTLALRFEIENTDAAPHDIAVHYVVHHVRRNGRAIPKVFKLAAVRLDPGERRALTKPHVVKEVQTRTYYPGRHIVEVQVNGVVMARDGFELVL